MLVDIDLAKAINDTLNKATGDVLKLVAYEAKKALYPKTIKGSEKAADLLDIEPSTLRVRLSKGMYCEGIHYHKKSDRIYLWDRDALLKEERNR